MRIGSAIKTTEALGQSEKFLIFQERLARVAPINRPVLLLGERGTGKELAAARLHYLSSRWDGPMVALNCSALNSSLIESELFGYERGAFTSANQRRTGRFEAADNGSIFLDEIGTIPLEVQEKILRVVEYGTFERVGSSESIEVDVRIIAATNADLKMLASKGVFKQDLLDRLSFEVLFLPPLRERKEDIMLLANYFAARMAFELKRDEIPVFSSDAVRELESYSWPGNVRELKNLVERAVYRSDSTVISDIIFDPFQSPYQMLTSNDDIDLYQDSAADNERNEVEGSSFVELVDNFKKNLVEKALLKSKFNQRMAARLLSLTYDQFRGLYRKYRGDEMR